MLEVEKAVLLDSGNPSVLPSVRIGTGALPLQLLHRLLQRRCVTVTSEYIGKGATFNVRSPLKTITTCDS